METLWGKIFHTDSATNRIDTEPAIVSVCHQPSHVLGTGHVVMNNLMLIKSNRNKCKYKASLFPECVAQPTNAQCINPLN